MRIYEDCCFGINIQEYFPKFPTCEYSCDGEVGLLAVAWKETYWIAHFARLRPSMWESIVA